MMQKFSGIIGIAACALSSAAVAAPNVGGADAGDAVQAALANHDLTAAGNALSNLVEARLPNSGVAKPDPLLDRLYADFLSTQGQLLSAGSILRRVVNDAATPDIDHYRLLLATFEEDTGEWPEARQQYRQILADPKASPEIVLSATLGIARLQMADDPSAALATLSSVDQKRVPPSMAWELDLLTERAANMAGPDKRTTAAAALDRAWAEAPNASVADSAVARLTSERALVAGRAGDRKTLVAMMAVDRSNRGFNTGQQSVVNDLPICGTGGITPQDFVLIDVAQRPPAGRPPITLAWASRPGIAAPFLLAAGRSGSPLVTDGHDATFGLRCRTVPSADYVVHNFIGDELVSWMTSQGAYPDSSELNHGGGTSLATRLARREARYGVNSVMLLPPLFRGAEPDAMNMGDQESRKQAAANAEHIFAILQQNHAPASLTLMWRLSSIGMAVAAQTKTASEGQAEFQELMSKVAGDPNLSLDTLYMLAAGTSRGTNIPSDFRAAMLASTLDILNSRAPAGDQRTAATALRLHTLRNAIDDENGARTAIARIDVPKDACDLSNPLPHYVSSNIASDDYPGDLIFTMMTGLSYAEFDLDAAGNAHNGRLVLEDPPFAFSQIALARIPTIRYDPARFDGKVSACRAAAQSIRWQIPYADD